MYWSREREYARIVLLLLWAGLLSSCARGQAIIAPAGRTVFNGESLIRSFTEIENLSVRTPEGQSIEVTQYVTPLAIVYGFHPNWELIAMQPYVVDDMTIRTPGEDEPKPEWLGRSPILCAVRRLLQPQ